MSESPLHSDSTSLTATVLVKRPVDGGADPYLQNLVSVSFCENLLGEKPLEAIRGAMGPRLRAELAKYEGA